VASLPRRTKPTKRPPTASCWLIFADGAKREACNPQGSLVEPPKDKQEREKITLQYQEEMLRRATENVQQKKQAIVQQTRRKTPAELAQEFDTKHSKDGPGILDGGFVIYADGAYRDGYTTMGVLSEPYDDPWNPGKLERSIVSYYELSLKRAEDELNKKREDWLMQAKINSRNRYIQAPPENTSKAAAELKQLKKNVLAARGNSQRFVRCNRRPRLNAIGSYKSPAINNPKPIPISSKPLSRSKFNQEPETPIYQ
jgi:hypothetical protein